jgi:hypothetical protein
MFTALDFESIKAFLSGIALLADRCHELFGQANPKVKLVGLATPHFLLDAKPAEALHEIQAFAPALGKWIENSISNYPCFVST